MNGGNYMKYFIKKWYKVISSILSIFFNTFGLFLSYVEINYGSRSKDSEKIFIILAIAELFLIIAVAYSIVSIISDKSKQIKLNDKINEIERITNANRIIYENNKSIITTYKDCTDTLRVRIKKYLNNNLRLNELNGESDSEKIAEYLKLDTAAIQTINEYVKNERIKEYYAFRDLLIDDYNRFLGNITNILRRSIEEYISTKKCASNVSVTVKQLEIPTLYNKINKSESRVFTAFRDYRTYSSKKRIETWQKSFSIDRNSDFFQSIEKEYYIFNFFDKQHLEQGQYQNENVTFYENYNSGVTCTIHSCIEEERKLFGYLACDSLLDKKVKKKCGTNVFDWNVTNLMMYTAHVIALYLEEFLDIWDSYCVDFSSDIPVVQRTPNIVANKEKALIETQDLESASDPELKGKIEFEKYKIKKQLQELTNNNFCNIMIHKVENNRYHN